MTIKVSQRFGSDGLVAICYTTHTRTPRRLWEITDDFRHPRRAPRAARDRGSDFLPFNTWETTNLNRASYPSVEGTLDLGVAARCPGSHSGSDALSMLPSERPPVLVGGEQQLEPCRLGGVQERAVAECVTGVLLVRMRSMTCAWP